MTMRRFLIAALLLALWGGVEIRAAHAAKPGAELFPGRPGVGTQRGFAVAVDGDWLAMGAPREDAVYLFRWIEGRWNLRQTLSPDSLREVRFGGALALRDGVLAVGALREGAVYVYQFLGEEWSAPARFSGQPGRFGRAVALGGGRLAVGETAPHGDQPGTVWIYTPLGSSWSAGSDVRKAVAPGNRFGEAVALDGDTLAAGDPADRESRGKVRVFHVITGQPPIPLQELTAPDGRAGDQFGAAVALSGDRLAAGAPTADRPSGEPEENTGAVYVAQRTGDVWGTPESLEAPGLERHDQLGSALALDRDLLAAGAPAPAVREGRGRVRVFRFADGWSEVAVHGPDNSELRDLTGFSVAVRGGRLAAGAVLGDPGGSAAGAEWTFDCETAEGDCAQEGEALVPDRTAGGHVGAAVALTKDLLAVGASPGEGTGGAVYVYRPAGAGWRQEARLTSPHPEVLDGFGSALALEGGILAVGAPDGSEGGKVYLFRRGGTAWSLAAVLEPGGGRGGHFGAALSLAGGVLAVGAPTNGTLGIGAGAVSVYHRDGQDGGKWTPDLLVTAPDGQPGDRFGTAVTVQDGILVVGSPAAVSFGPALSRPAHLIIILPEEDGVVYIYKGSAGRWSFASRLEPPLGLQFGGRFGAALSLDGETLAVGGPGSGTGGFVQLFKRPQWTPQGPPLAPPFAIRFGSALAVHGGELLAGAPGTGKASDPPGQVLRFQRNGSVWAPAGTFQAVTPAQGDRFGAGLALDGGAFVVASPGSSGGDRVTVFGTSREETP